jgi:hypothetical protein
MLTQEQLKSILHYNSETGVFTWIKSARGGWDGKVAGCISGTGYISIKILGNRFQSHRLAWLYIYGALPEGMLDHIDGNRTNNVFSNLRLASGSQNNANSKRQNSNTSGYKGVCWHVVCNKWVAQIKKDGKQRYLGSFDCPKEAHEAYKRAALELHGEFAHFG